MPSYLAAVRERCFICALRDGVEGYEHHVLADDPTGFAFLARYPWVSGHAIVTPRRHCEDVIGGMTNEDATRLHHLVRRVGAALQRVLPCERIYVLSLGSAQANAHVHWHVVPCPPGLPYEEQQLQLMMNGYLEIPENELEDLAASIRAAIEHE